MSAPRPFDALLLDFGHVVLLTPFEVHERVEAHYGLEPGTLSWMGPYDPATDPLWVDQQAGRISERDYWRIRAEEITPGGLREYIRVCYAAPEEEIIRPEAAALVADAKAAGLRVGVLTNETELFHGREWMDRMAFFAAMDTIVDASVTGVLKPDPRAYQLALEGLGLPAERVLFVDDQPANVAGAEAIGLPTVAFDVTDVAGMFKLIRERLTLD